MVQLQPSTLDRTLEEQHNSNDLVPARASAGNDDSPNSRGWPYCEAGLTGSSMTASPVPANFTERTARRPDHECSASKSTTISHRSKSSGLPKKTARPTCALPSTNMTARQLCRPTLRGVASLTGAPGRRCRASNGDGIEKVGDRTIKIQFFGQPFPNFPVLTGLATFTGRLSGTCEVLRATRRGRVFAEADRGRPLPAGRSNLV